MNVIIHLDPNDEFIKDLENLIFKNTEYFNKVLNYKGHQFNLRFRPIFLAPTCGFHVSTLEITAEILKNKITFSIEKTTEEINEEQI